jgi:hypothetical protein
MMLPGELSAAIDAWIARQKAPRPSRPEAIRRLIVRGLTEAGTALRAEAQGQGSAPARTRRKAAAKRAPAKPTAAKRPARRRA